MKPNCSACLHLKIIICFLSLNLMILSSFNCSKSPGENEYYIPDSADEIVAEIMALGKTDFNRTAHPDAQWFPRCRAGGSSCTGGYTA